MAASLLTGCGGGDSSSAPAADSGDSGAAEAPEAPAADTDDSGSEAPAADAGTSGGGSDTINVWAFTDEVPGMIEKYIEAHPEFGYQINTTIIATTDGAYQPALDQALAAGGAEAPDIYCAEAAFVLKYTQGDASGYAMPYADMGIDVDAKLKEADIAQYTVDIGTNPDGQLVGLGYQATGGAFIYRRSIAKDV